MHLVGFTIEIIPAVILARGSINLTRGFSGFSLGYSWRSNLNYAIISSYHIIPNNGSQLAALQRCNSKAAPPYLQMICKRTQH